MARVIPAVLAALMLPAAAHAATASVRVKVANVWAHPGTATIPTDFHVWPTGTVVQQRLPLVGHMPTQVLFGEQVVVLRRAGSLDGDRRSRPAVAARPARLSGLGADVAARPALRRQPTAVTVTAPSARLTDGMQLSFATRLPSLGRKGGTVVVEVPGGTAAIPAAAVAALPVTRTDIVRTAELFLGPALSVGRPVLVGHGLFRPHLGGVPRPRDHDPAGRGRAVRRRPAGRARERAAGDLIFYGVQHVHHVAMYLGHDR